MIDQAVQRAEALALENPGITPDHLRELMAQDTGSGAERLHESLARHVADHAHRLAYATRKGRVTVVRDVEKALPLATLSGLSVAHVMDLDRWYVERGIGSNTRRSRLRRLRTMYRAACKSAGIPSKDLFDGLIPAEVDHGAKFLPVEELATFAGATLPTASLTIARDAWMLAYHLGGMRVGDLCRLNWSMVDGDAIGWTAGKVPKPRWVPLGPGALAIMERYRGALNILPLVKEGLSGDPLAQAIETATANLNRSLKEVCRILGIRPLTMHMARHTWAETAQSATLDVRSVSRVLGHTRTATTERYLSRFDRAMIKGVFDRIEDASTPKGPHPKDG
jgi:integrase